MNKLMKIEKTSANNLINNFMKFTVEKKIPIPNRIPVTNG